MDQVLLPLTRGLLTSAMMRYNHALFEPYFPGTIGSDLMGDSVQRISRALPRVLAIRDAIAAGRDDYDRQVGEEFLGRGYYTTAGEDGYAMSLAAFPEALEMVDRAIREREKG